MNPVGRIAKVGILGCGAIGSGVAKRFKTELKNSAKLSGLYDIDENKSRLLDKELKPSASLVKKNLASLIKSCDIVFEAVSAKNTRQIIIEIIQAKKSVIVMSVGQLLNAKEVFALAKKNRCKIVIPSGAIAGIDAIKAADCLGIDKITLTTRKPVTGFRGNSYVENKHINLDKLNKEKCLFEGTVEEAVRYFPQNINVAATIALACKDKKMLKVRIITSPEFKINSHEVEISGKFGKITTRTDNTISPDNPKTSYLAVLSGIQALKDFCEDF
ncbi:MAG: DUF108 domain-containing protein [Candidatus Omnitrophica bacterium]|nr:DUF108 domain-containing protein [Candidatus Omnitrophota bacterium]